MSCSACSILERIDFEKLIVSSRVPTLGLQSLYLNHSVVEVAVSV